MIAVLALAMICAAPTSRLDEIRARGKLIVAVKNEGTKVAAAHKDPAHFQKRNFELKLAERLAKDLLGDEKKLELVILPRPERLKAVAKGDVDLVISMIQVNEANTSVVDFSSPYYESGFAVMVTGQSPIKALGELDGKKLAVPAQTANDPRARLTELFAARKQNVALQSFATFKLASEALEAGRVDALVSHDANVDAFLADSKSKLKKLPELLTHDVYAVGVKKGEGALLRAVDQTIEKLKASGELAAFAENAHLK